MATINFGDIELNKENFLTSAANDVNEYVQSLAWSSKRKNMFMDAYNDLMAQNITGAKVIDGSWHILYDNDLIDLSKMSNKLKLMYKEAAWYIKSKMEENLPSKNEVKEEVKAFNNADEFRNYVKRQLYGDLEFSFNRWTGKDTEFGNNGLRSIEKRKAALIETLQDYSKYLDTKDFDYSNTPYGSKENLLTAISNAINALNNNGDYNDALNRLGLNPQDWLNDGSNDIVATDENGRDITRAEYNQLQQHTEQQNGDSKTDTEQKKVDDGFRIRKSNTKFENNPIFGVSLETLTLRFGGDDEKLYTKLTEYYNRGVNNLSKDETDELYGIYSNLAKSSISDDEYKMLLRFTTLKDRLKGNFRKLQGVDGLYLDRKSRRVIQLYNENQTRINPNYGKSLLPKTQTEKEKESQQQLRKISLVSDLLYEDYARIGAALGDIISLGGFGANVVGSIVSLIGDTTADIIADDKVSTWEAFKNLGRNLGWTAAGFIPGAKFGKIAKNIMRWGPKLMVALNNYNLLKDESSRNTADKLLSDRLIKEGINEEDLRNITYWVRAFTGDVNALKATARDMKYSKARGTAGLEFTTKDGETIKLSNEAVLEINAAGARKGLKAAEAKFKEKAKEATGKEHEVAEGSFNFSENGRKGLFKNTRSKLLDLRLEGKSTVFRTLEQLRYYDLLLLDRSKGGWFGWRPLNWRGTSSYFDHFDTGFRLKNPFNGVLRKLDPYKNVINTEPKTKSTTTSEGLVIENPKSSNPEIQQTENIATTNNRLVISRPYKAGPKKQAKIADKKLIKEVLKKSKYTDEFPNEGVITFKGPDGNTHRLEVSFSKDGNNYNVTRTSSDGSLSATLVGMEELKSYIAKQLQEILNGKRNDVQLARLIKELRKSKFGWLKQGGKFNLDKEISNFLKEMNV